MSTKRQAPKQRGATRRDLFLVGNSLLMPALLADAAPPEATTGPLKIGRDIGKEIYRSIGVEPVINCRGTFTIIGASIELPEVRAAMDAAAHLADALALAHALALANADVVQVRVQGAAVVVVAHLDDLAVAVLPAGHLDRAGADRGTGQEAF